jgi:hypothetical protein
MQSGILLLVGAVLFALVVLALALFLLVPDDHAIMRFEALCGVRHNFDRCINAPYALGRGVCKRCKKQSLR